MVLTLPEMSLHVQSYLKPTELTTFDKMFQFEERLDYRDYVTARLTRRHPIYNWYTYPHSFSKELVHMLLDEFSAGSDDVICDPFVGAGTTLLACRERQISAFGLDQLPFSVFVSNAKIHNYDARELEELLNNFTLDKTVALGERTLIDIALISKAFSKDVYDKIIDIYRWIGKLASPEIHDFFLLALMHILESISQTSKVGGWLRMVGRNVNASEIEQIFKARAHKMIQDLKTLKLPRNNGEWMAIQGDARRAFQLDHRVSHVITSPPYLNRHDYTRVFALELALHFVHSNDELKTLRRGSLRSHVEAKSECAPAVVSYVPSVSLDAIVAEVQQKCSANDKLRIPRMIVGYFEDMYSTLNSCSKCIQSDGYIAFVVGNVRFCGVMIPVDELIAEIGEQLDLVVQKIIVCRYRGNSAQQMGTYGRAPSRESVVVWKKSNPELTHSGPMI